MYGISLKCSPKLTVYFSENVLAIQPAFKSVTDYHTKFEAASDDHVFRVIERFFGPANESEDLFLVHKNQVEEDFGAFKSYLPQGPKIFIPPLIQIN